MKYRIVYTFVLICSLIFSVTAQYENPDGQIHSVIIEKDRIYTENYAKEYLSELEGADRTTRMVTREILWRFQRKKALLLLPS